MAGGRCEFFVKVSSCGATAAYGSGIRRARVSGMQQQGKAFGVVRANLNSLQDINAAFIRANCITEARCPNLNFARGKSKKLKPKSVKFRHKSGRGPFLGECGRAQQLVEEVLEEDDFLKVGRCRFHVGRSSSVVDTAGHMRIPQLKDDVSWTELISGYVDSGKYEEALRSYKEMLEAGVKPSVGIFLLVLKACSSSGDIETGKAIHGHVIESEHTLQVVVTNSLMDMYVKCGSMMDARRAFDSMLERSTVSWNVMILGYAKKEEGEMALELYAQMQQQGLRPNDRTFVGALKACSTLAAQKEGTPFDKKVARTAYLEKGRAIHSQVLKNGFESNSFVGTMLVDMYVKCGSMVDALHVFERLTHRDVVSWTAMMSGYVEKQQGEVGLQFYAQMQAEGVAPNDRTFVCASKACGILAALEDGKEGDGKSMKTGSLEKGRAIHSQVVKRGYELDVFVNTTLVDMYAKCGSLMDARRVFDKLPRQNVVGWTAMILGHVEKEEAEVALQYFTRMQHEGIEPDDRTFVAALKACSTLAAREERMQVNGESSKTWCLKKGKAIHTEIVDRGFESDIFVGNSLIDMYAKCGSVISARNVFDKLPHRDVVSWNAMIQGYAEKLESHEALQLFAQMQRKGVEPNDRTFVVALKACSSLAAIEKCVNVDGISVKRQCLEKGRAIHFQAVESGFESDAFVGKALIDMYAKCGSMVDAQHVFDKLSHHDVVSWTAMILGYAEKQESKEAFQLYAQMQQKGVLPNDRTFVGVLKACSSVRCLETARAIHSQVVKAGFDSDIYVGTTLVDMYAKCGSMEDAQHVFDELPRRDVVSWNAIMWGHAEKEDGELALQLYAQMFQEATIADDRTFAAALNACGHLASREEGKQVDGRIVKIQCLEKGRAIHLQAEKSGFESDVFVGTTLLGMYARCGSILDARHVFDSLPHRDVVSWNAMILAYAEHGESKKAFNLYAQMEEQGLSADSLTFVSILKACGNTAALETGREIHARICRVGLEHTGIVAATLIDMYGRCGSMVDAQHVFDALPTRDPVTWNTLIAGYARQGESTRVFRLFERMRQEGVKANEVTFLSVLSVCGHGGLVREGQKYFEAMSMDYGITQTIDLYTCMVDILARAGQVEEAVEMVEKMHFLPNIVAWRTVLGACRKWNNLEVGRYAFERAVKLDKKHAAAYVLMSNIYGDAQMWDDCHRIHAMRKEAGAWKSPGLSWWTDAAKNVHSFLVGDANHPQSQDIYAKLEEISSEMVKEV